MIQVPLQFKNKIFSVLEISNLVSEVLKSPLFSNISIKGEIKSKDVKSGNVYLNLIQVNENKTVLASIKVIIFSYYDRNITCEYKVGDEVIVKGDLSYYAPFGQLSLNAKYLTKAGEGEDLLKLKRLKEKLEKEGLFDQKRKKPLPSHIRTVGIITSKSGAAYHDILNVLKKKFPVNTILFDCVVQGSLAPESIVKALDKAYKSNCDVLIFGRGGGSKTDLDCYNDERVVRKLAESNKVIISGIGHEIDTSLSDYVVDIHQITPTAAAEACLKDFDEVKKDISDLSEDLTNKVITYMQNKSLMLNGFESLLERYSPKIKILSLKNKIVDLSNKLDILKMNYISLKEKRNLVSNNLLDTNIKNFIFNKYSQITNLDNKLTLANPLNNLKEGYCYVKLNNKSISSVDNININDELELGFKDGIVYSKVTKKEKNK